MKQSLNVITLAWIFCFTPAIAPAQTNPNPSSSIDSLPAVPEGFVSINHRLYFVQQGRADSPDLTVRERAKSHGISDLDQFARTLEPGQMLTLEGKVIRLPASVVFTHSPAAEEDAREAAAAADRTNLDTTLAPKGSGVPAPPPGSTANRSNARPNNPGGNDFPAGSAPATSSNNGGGSGAFVDPNGPGDTIIVNGGNLGGLPNGTRTVTTPNGAVTTPTVTNPNGTVTNADGTVTYPNGKTTKASGTTTANPNGTATNANGTTTNATGSTTNATGTNTNTTNGGTTSTGSRATSSPNSAGGAGGGGAGKTGR